MMPDADYLAPIIVRLDRLEEAVRLIVEAANRVSTDTLRMEEELATVQAELREVRACALGRS
jgi:hypothetical protein